MSVSYRNRFIKGTRVIYGHSYSVTGPALFLEPQDIAALAVHKAGVPGVETRGVFEKVVTTGARLLETKRMEDGWQVERDIDFLALAKLLVARKGDNDMKQIAQAIEQLSEDCAKKFPDQALDIKARTQVAMCFLRQQKKDMQFKAHLRHEEDEDEEEEEKRRHIREEENHEKEEYLSIILGTCLLTLPLPKLDAMLNQAVTVPKHSEPRIHASQIIGKILLKSVGYVEKMFGMDIPPELKRTGVKLDIAEGLDNLGRFVQDFRPDVCAATQAKVQAFNEMYRFAPIASPRTVSLGQNAPAPSSPFEMEFKPSFMRR